MHHALSGRDPALEPPFSFPTVAFRYVPTLLPRLCELVDQALKYDVALRVADAPEGSGSGCWRSSRERLSRCRRALRRRRGRK